MHFQTRSFPLAQPFCSASLPAPSNKPHVFKCTSLVRIITHTSLKLWPLISNGSRTLLPEHQHCNLAITNTQPPFPFQCPDHLSTRPFCQTLNYNCLKFLPLFSQPPPASLGYLGLNLDLPSGLCAWDLLLAPVVSIPGHPWICGTALPLAKRARHANTYAWTLGL